MKAGSYKDVLQWLGSPWLRRSVTLAFLSYLLWQAVEWARAPGFYGHNGLSDPNATALALAQERYGPVLLIKWWIKDPPGSWGDKDGVLQGWGYWESKARLELIVGILWVVICCLFLFPRIRGAKLDGGCNSPSTREVEK